MTGLLVFWVGLAVATAGLAIYRKILAAHEDPGIHLAAGGDELIASQAAMTNKLVTIDKWGKTMTVVTLALGLVIGAIYVYEAFRAVPI